MQEEQEEEEGEEEEEEEEEDDDWNGMIMTWTSWLIFCRVNILLG